MKISDMKKHLDELSSKHPLGDEAPFMITIQPTFKFDIPLHSRPYKCTRFIQTTICDNPSADDLAYVDLEVDD